MQTGRFGVPFFMRFLGAEDDAGRSQRACLRACVQSAQERNVCESHDWRND